MQHAPGCGQGVGVQAVPSPCQVPRIVVHTPPSDTITHTPEVRQHAPVQGLGAQTVAAPCQTLPD
jgi:hypothetical protein